jgi:hypothetical protein
MKKVAGFLFLMVGALMFFMGITSFGSGEINSEGTCRSICGLLLLVESLFGPEVSAFIQSIVFMVAGSALFLLGATLKLK